MKPKTLALLALCFATFSLAPTAISFNANAQGNQDETKLRSLVTDYYDLYQKKDLAAMKELWSARSPARDRLSVEPTAEYTFSHLNISRIHPQHDSATLQVSFDLLIVNTRNYGSGIAEHTMERRHDVRQFVFVKEANEWKIWREDAAAMGFGAELILAKTDADVQKLLEENKDLLGKDLRYELTTSANSYLANGDPANALKGFFLVLKVSELTHDETDLAQTRFMIGFIQMMQGKHALAVENFEKALSEYESKSDKRGTNITLYNLGNAFYMQSIYDRALDAFRKSLEMSKALNERGDAANAAYGLALVYKELHDDKRALEYYLVAIPDYYAAGNTSTLPEAEASVAAIYYAQNNYIAAVDHFKSALTYLEALDDRADKPKIANVLTNLANSYYQEGDYAQAFESYEKCLTLGKEMRSKEWQAIAEEGMGLVLMMQGIYQSSLEHYSISLAMNLETANEPGTMRVLSGIGDVYRSENSNALAIDYYKRALTIAKELNDRNSAATLLANCGLAFGAQGLYSIALDYHQQSYGWFQQLRNQTGVASSLGNIGGVYFAQGNYPLALDAFQKSLPILDSIGDTAGSAAVLRGIGLVHTAQGNYPDALESYAKSLKQFESLDKKPDIAIDLVDIGITLGLQGDYKQSLDNVLRAAAIAKEIGSRDTLWHAQFRAGDAYRHLDQSPQARQSFEDAIKTIEEMRRQVISSIEASNSSADRCAPYLAMVDLLIAQSKTNEALAYAELAKSQALLDLLLRSGITIDKGLTPQQRDQEFTLKGELISLTTQIYREKHGKQPDQSRLDSLEKLRQQKQIEYGQFQSKLNMSNPYLRVLRGEQKPLRPEEASRLLPDASTVLLDYVVTDTNAYLFAISRAAGAAVPRVEVYVLNASRQVLADKTRGFRSAIENKDDGANALAKELFSALVNPAKERLEGKSSIIVIPDDSLWYLPFQALAPNEGKFLIEDFDISYAPSLTALDEMKKLRVRNSAPGKSRLLLFAVGDPVLNDETKNRISLFEPGRNLSARAEEEKQLKEFGTLYGTAQSRIFAQAEAKERTAKTEAGKSRYLHFTANGTINDAAPLHSYVALSKGETGENEDGLMEAGEILTLDLKADLAILSGSKIAGPQPNTGRGLLGLSWAFFVGGCPDIMVSQWQTDSPISTELMISFHKKLKGEIGAARSEVVSKSWRGAVLEMLKKPDGRQPYNWAGFTLVGAQR